MQNFKFTYDYKTLSEFTKWALTNTNIDPKLISDVYGYDEKELWAYITEVDATLREAEEERKKYLPTLQKQVQEFRDEFPPEFRKEIRKNYLENQLDTYRKEFDDGCIEYSKEKKKGLPVNSKQLEELEKKIARIMFETKIIKGFESGLSQLDVQRAKVYPIENMIEVKRNYALCPFHMENTPSMYIKNNVYHCFGCSEHGDVLDLFMKINNVGFIEAVKRLS